MLHIYLLYIFFCLKNVSILWNLSEIIRLIYINFSVVVSFINKMFWPHQFAGYKKCLLIVCEKNYYRKVSLNSYSLVVRPKESSIMKK